MQRRAARVLRGAFYFCLGVVVLQVSGAMGAPLGQPDTIGIPNYFSEGLIYGDLIAICVMTVLAMTFRFSALHIEKSEPAAQNRRLTLRSALLLYPFKWPAAAITRIVFWFWAALTIVMAIATVLAGFDERLLIPVNLVSLVAFVGWAVGLRYWAISLNARSATAAGRASSAPAIVAASPGD
jgi:hypothetical protein